MTVTARDLNDVAVFVKVVELSSFSAAGKALGLPNSSVSRKVTRLEQHLGVRLLHRTTRKLSLTDVGQLYYERGQQLLAGLEAAESELSNTLAAPRGRVKMVTSPEFGVSMALVSEFLDRYPDVRVDLRLTSEPVNIIQEGYDLAIVAGPVTNLSVTAKKLMDSRFQMVASPDYLARRGEPTTVAELADHECVVFGSSSSNAIWQLQVDSEPVALPVRGRIAANHMGAVVAAAVAGHGIALVPTLTCARALARGTLRAVLPGSEPPSVPLYVTYESGPLLTAAVRLMLDHLVARFSELAESATA